MTETYVGKYDHAETGDRVRDKPDGSDVTVYRTISRCKGADGGRWTETCPPALRDFYSVYAGRVGGMLKSL